MSETYSAAVCDLCGSAESEAVYAHPGRSMTSDSRIVCIPLEKVRCVNCGLLRNGRSWSEHSLREHYGRDYQLGPDAEAAEPLFYTSTGPIPRSRIVAEWIAEAIRAVHGGPIRRIGEVGCSEGAVLRALGAGFPRAELTGVEPSETAAAAARAHDVDVACGGYELLPGGLDVIYAFAVMEHLPSPRRFLETMRERLAPGGVLVVAQPCADGVTHDVFFSDHLYHFHAHHVEALGRAAGLREDLRWTTHEHIRDFSLHAFRIGEAPAGAAPPAGGDTEAFWTWRNVFDRLNAWLTSVGDGPIAVWGIGETFTLLHCYTALYDRTIVVAFDDNADRFASRGFPFPVLPFHTWAPPADEARPPLLLTFRPNPRVLEALHERDMLFWSPFEAEEG